MANLGGTAEVYVFRPIWGGRFFVFLRKAYNMIIDDQLVCYIESLSKLSLNEVEKESIKKELSSVITYTDILNNLDVEGIEPLSHIFDITNVMRDDEVAESFDRDLLLDNAPLKTDGSFTVPRTVE